MSRSLTILAVLLLVGCWRNAPPAAGVPEPINAASVPPDDQSIPPPRVIPQRSPDESLAAGVAFLLAAQSADGAWRSDVYATFKDGLALTPLVVRALQDAAASGVKPAGAAVARHKGCAFLAKLVKADGTIDPGPDGLDYPLYTAALSIQVLTHADGNAFRAARDGWVKYLKDRQLTAKLGWKPDEKQYGGWGYCRVLPKKPEPNAFAPSLIESNLSATTFALDALKTAGEADPEVYKAAAIFVRRCQNEVISLPGRPALVHLDGGFHFIYDDPTRNKAGMAPREDPESPSLFNSYGSTTADGFRALKYCGFAEDVGREKQAADWLVKNFRADTHPGKYVQAHEPNREAVYYYYAASVSRAFREHGLALPGARDWSAELASELCGRQRRDGSWVNPIELVRENEPLVATCNAVSALARCRKPAP